MIIEKWWTPRATEESPKEKGTDEEGCSDKTDYVCSKAQSIIMTPQS